MVLTENESEDDIPLAKVAKKMSIDEDSRSNLGVNEESMDSVVEKPVKVVDLADSSKHNLQVVKFDVYFEYEWPRIRSGCFYILEEFFAKYLNIEVFDERLKDVSKRCVEDSEKEYLRTKDVLQHLKNTEDIKVILVEDACQLMVEKFPKKFQEYIKGVHKKEMQKLVQKQELQRARAITGKIPSFMRRALKETVRYNSRLNAERKEERQAYFDLQTQIIHLPQKRRIYDPDNKPERSLYPVSLMPGQYQDYYRKYTTDELKQFPLNTITKSFQNKKCKQQDDDTGEGKNTNNGNDEKEIEEKLKDIAPDKDPFCGICKQGPEKNKRGQAEKLIHCSQCENSGHPSCLDMNRNLVTVIQTYPWQCMECKICSECLAPHDEESMMFCDHCDRGYHSYCVGLKEIPKGRWVCERCGKCTSCLSREPVPKGENGRWKNEFTKPQDGSEPEFLQIHCHRCSKYFRKGNFCPVCLKIYESDDELQSPMICCDTCDRWIHTDCDDIDENRYMELSNDNKSSYICILCRGEKEERMDAYHRKNR